MSLEEQLLRGVAAHRRGDFHAAIDCYWQLLRAQPSCAEAYHNLAEALCALGHTEDARQSYLAALRLQPGLTAALRGLATLLFRLGEFAAAESRLRRAVQLEPAAIGQRVHLALALAAQGAVAAARDELEWALELSPEHPLALAALAQVCQQLGHIGAAIDYWRRAVDANPRQTSYTYNLARALQSAGQMEETATIYRDVLRQAPRHAAAAQNLTSVLAETGDTAGALEAAASWCEIEPQSAAALCGLAAALHEAGHHRTALRAAHQALSVDPLAAASQLLVAQLELAGENFEAGWRYYTCRKRLAPARFSWPAAVCDLPEWQGPASQARRVMVLAEQGLGEELMHSTCYADLLRHAPRVTLVCHPQLAELLARSFPTARVVPADHGLPVERALAEDPVDARVMAGDLLGIFRRQLRQFQPPHGGHLTASPNQVAEFRRRLATPDDLPRIGLAWQGGSTTSDRQRRSVPLAGLRPLVERHNATFVALQHGATRPQLREALGAAAARVSLPAELDCSSNLREIAALTASLDLVISAANTTLHLAGALGVPALGLLRAAADWWWFRDRADCLWYASVELARQDEPGNWSGCLAAAERRMMRTTAALTAKTAASSAGMRLDRPHEPLVIHVLPGAAAPQSLAGDSFPLGQGARS